MLWEIADDDQNLGVNWPVTFDERASDWSQAREQGEDFKTKKMTFTRNLHKSMSALCTEKPFLSHSHDQLAPSCTSVRSRREYWKWKHPLYWNPKKPNLKYPQEPSHNKLLFESKCAQSVQENHGLPPVDYRIQRCEHDGTANMGIKLTQWQQISWPSVHFLKQSNFLEQSWHPILVIWGLTTFVVVRQFREKIKRLRLHRHNPDTKITCWMRSQIFCWKSIELEHDERHL